MRSEDMIVPEGSSRSLSRAPTSRIAFMRSSSLSGPSDFARIGTSLPDLRLWVGEEGLSTGLAFCLLTDGEMGGEVEEESASAVGMENGWSFSTSCSLRFILKFLTESSCRKMGASSGGPPARELMSMSGFGGIRGRLLD